MNRLDQARAYLAVRANGWSHGEAVRTAGVVGSLGGLSAVKSMLFSAGGLNVSGGGLYWPNSFRKLTDPWPERVGFDPQGISLDQFWRNSTAQACLSWIQRTFPEPRIRVMDGDGEEAQEVRGHAFTRLLNEPNEDYTPHALWQVTLADWWVTGRGNAYWQVAARNRAGQPLQVWHVPAAEMKPDWPTSGPNAGRVFISQYVRTVNGEANPVDKRDVIHFRFGQDPFNARLGYSPVLAGAAEIGVLNEGAVYRGSVLGNTGVVSHVLTPKDMAVAEAMDPDRVDDLNRLWKDKTTGRNRGSLFIPNFAADLTRAGFSPQEMDIRAMLEWDVDIICALFGLNSMILGLPSGEGHRTYANQADAREAAFESNIIPTQGMFAATLTKLLRQFDPNPRLRVSWDYSCVRVLQEDQNKLYARLNQAVAGKWVRPSEARAKVNLKPDPELDGRALEKPEPSVNALVPAAVPGKNGKNPEPIPAAA